MRVCPNTVKCPRCGTEIKCGYVEYEYWRQNRWRTNVEFTKPEEFKLNYPALYRQLEEGKPTVLDLCYAYRFSGKRKKVVERVWIEEYRVDPKHAFSIPREHVDHTKIQGQKKLWVECQQ